jgi:glycine/D-amino acid oxidase-like deaminating enzyme
VNTTAPIWADGAGRAFPTLPAGTTRADVAVIGGGFAGLSAAYHVLERRPGARVLVLEAGRLGAGASGRTTGILSPGVGQALGALVRRHGPARAKALYLATTRAVEDVVTLVAAERIACDLEMTGQLTVAGEQRASRARLAALAALHARLGLGVEMLDDDALERLIRLPGARRYDGAGPAAIRLPSAGTLHPMRLVAGLAERVSARGGTIAEGCRVRALGDRRPVRLDVDGERVVIADDVVVATSAYTPGLGLLHGRVLPVHLQVLVTAPLDHGARDALGWKGREALLDARRIFSYARLTADDRIVFGGGAPRYRWGGGAEDDGRGAAALDALAGELRRTFGAVAPPVAGGWTGVIDYVLDGLPAIQRLRGRPSVLHAVGWCGHGVALSVASGAWIASILCDGAVPEDLPWFRDDPPLLPLEPLRWLGFQATVRGMALLDRLG